MWHDPVQVAEYRSEDAVPLLEGRLVGDAALFRALDGDVVAHKLDEGKPTRSSLRQRSRTVPLGKVNLLPGNNSATWRDAGGGVVPPGVASAAPGAFLVRSSAQRE